MLQKNTILYLLICFISIMQMSFAQTTAIPDVSFEQELVNLGIDDVIDGQVLTSNINAVTYLNINNVFISDLTGIEDFSALEILSIENASISHLILTAMTNLSILNLNDNINLTHLSLSYTQNITAIDVSSLTSLVELNIRDSNIAYLDLTNNSNIATFYGQNSALQGLNVKNGNNTNINIFNITNNPNLYSVVVDNIAYANANFTQKDAQTEYMLNSTSYVPDDVFENYLETHNASGDIVMLGDPSSLGNGIANDNTASTTNTTSTNLDLSNLNIEVLTGIELFNSLQTLNLNNTNITDIDLSNITSLSNVNVSNNTNVTHINLSNITNLSNVDVSNNTNLLSLDVSNTNIADIDVSNSTSLIYLDISNTNLSSLNVSNNTNLFSLDASNTNISDIDVSSSNSLTDLDISNTNLSSLNASNTNLMVLNVSGMSNLSSLNVGNMSKLMFLSLSYTQNINDIDVSNSPLLEELNIRDSHLTQIDLSNNPSIATFYGQNTALQSLNIKNGNNTNINIFNITNNSNLLCVDVDNTDYANANFTQKDIQTTYSTDCSNVLSNTDFEISNLKIYPNPTTNILTIEGASQYEVVEIYTVTGLKVLENFVNQNKNILNISQLTNGVYFLKIEAEKGHIIRKIIKK